MEPRKRRIKVDDTPQTWGEALFGWKRTDLPSSASPTTIISDTVGGVPLGMKLSHSECSEADARSAPSTTSHPPQAFLGKDAPMPLFTSRDEEREFASLTSEEIAASEADVQGLTADMAGATIQDDVVGKAGLIAALHAELDRMPGAEKAAYVEATRRCPEQVNEEHMKGFLWREDYDVKLAAKRLIRYWAKRRALFGQDKWYLPLTLHGALRDDILALRSEFIRALPSLDEYGRMVLLLEPFRYDFAAHTVDSMLRAFWYMCHYAAHDPVIQRRGLVMVVKSNGVGPNLSKMELNRSIADLGENVLPVICRATHYCKPRSFFHLVSPVIKYFIGKRLRGRYRVHYGSQEEILRSMSAYGLPRERLPTGLGGEVVLRHDEWLAQRLAEECQGKIDSSTAAVRGALGSSSLDAATNDLAEDWEPIRCLPGASPIQTTVNPTSSPLHLPDASPPVVLAHQAHRETPPNAVVGNTVMKMPETLSIPCMDANRTIVPETSRPRQNSRLVDCKVFSAVGCKGDPRMHKAVKAIQDNPELTLTEAVLEGGFVFPEIDRPFMTAKTLLDTENVSMYQRKNQLSRRLRKMQSKKDTAPVAAPSKKKCSTGNHTDKAVDEAGSSTEILSCASSLADSSQQVLKECKEAADIVSHEAALESMLDNYDPSSSKKPLSGGKDKGNNDSRGRAKRRGSFDSFFDSVLETLATADGNP